MKEYAYHGVDFDGTLAYKSPNWSGNPYDVGAPIGPMVERVKNWLANGEKVRIITARMAPHGATYEDGRPIDPLFIPKTKAAIEIWCLEHIGVILPVQAYKDRNMIDLWDDQAVQVIINTGMPIVNKEHE